MLHFKMTVGVEFILVSLEGLVTLDAWEAVLHRISGALPTRDAPRRLVIDMRSVLGYLGVPERTAVGALMAHHLGGMQRVAIVVQAEKITNVVHNEARRNGLDLRLFPHYDEATVWVTS